MASKIKITLGTLLLVILSSSFYIMLPDNVRIDFEKSRTVFKVYEDDKFVRTASEYVRLFDGSKKMLAKSRRNSYSIYEDNTNILKEAFMYRDNVKIEQFYYFDNNVQDIEQIPILETVCFYNATGKIFEWLIQDIYYNGSTKDITSPFSFGKSMKIDFEDGYYRAKVYQNKYAPDKVIVRYRIVDDFKCFNVKLYDPPLTVTKVQKVNVPFQKTVEQRTHYGWIDDKFCNWDGLCYVNSSNGFFKIYDNEGNFIRNFGFGITSDQINRSVLDFSWDWNFDTDTDTFIQTFANAVFNWTISYDFDSQNTMKITNYVENDWQTLTDTSFHYIMTVTENDTATYNGGIYNMGNDYYRTNNLNNVVPKIDFNGIDIFNYTDLIDNNFDIQSIKVGEGNIWGTNKRVFDLAFTKNAGTFNVGTSVYIDPSIQGPTSVNLSVGVFNNTVGNKFIQISPNLDDIIGFYNFDIDDVGDSIGSDLSGNDNDCTVGSAATGITSGGYTRNGFSDNGIDTNNEGCLVSGGDYAGLNSTFSAFARFNPDNIENDKKVFEIALDDTYMQLRTSGNIRCLAFGLSDATGNEVASNGVGSWTTAGCMYNGTDLCVYINGAFDCTPSNGTRDNSGEGLGIGSAALGNNGQFNGTIDDVIIFNHSLSLQDFIDLESSLFYTNGQHFSEVVALNDTYNRTNVSVYSDIPSQTSLNISVSEAVLPYNENFTSLQIFRGDGNDGEDVLDRSDWTVRSLAIDNLKVGNYWLRDGVVENDDKILGTTGSPWDTIETTDEMTICMKYAFDTLPSEFDALYFQDDGMNIQYSSNDLRCVNRGTSVTVAITTAGTILGDGKYHIGCCVKDNESSRNLAYLDGSLGANTSDTGTYTNLASLGQLASAVAFNATIEWVLLTNYSMSYAEAIAFTDGTYDFTNFTDSQPLSDGVDTVTFNISDDSQWIQIIQEYGTTNTSKTPVKFDENVTIYLQEAVTPPTVETPPGNLTIDMPLYGSIYNFMNNEIVPIPLNDPSPNSSGGYNFLPANNTYINIEPRNEQDLNMSRYNFTLSAFVTIKYNNTNSIFVNNFNYSGDYGLLFRIGTLRRVQLFNGSTSKSSTGKINIGEKTHVAVTNNGTHTSFYINGTLDSSTEQVFPTVAGFTNTLMGTEGSNFKNFNGTIEKFKMYNGVRNAANISLLSNDTTLNLTRNLEFNKDKDLDTFNEYFFGANTHGNYLSNYSYIGTDAGSSTETQSNFTWHREKATEAGVNYLRADSYLSTKYSTIPNRGAEVWVNTSIVNPSQSGDLHYPAYWYAQSFNGNGSVNQSIDARTGTYAVNITSDVGNIFSSFNLGTNIIKANYEYNASIWIKTDDVVVLAIQEKDNFSSVCTGSTSGTGSYEQVTCVFNESVLSNNGYRMNIEANGGESLVWDDLLFKENGINYEEFFEVDGSNFKNINKDKDMVEYAYNNGLKVLYVAGYMNAEFANLSNDCITNDDTCPPLNNTDWANFVLKFINNITLGGTYISAIEIETWNEPDIDNFWFSDVDESDVNRVEKFNALHQEVYDVLKAAYPNLQIGGPGTTDIVETTNAKNFFTSFAGNTTNKTDYLSLHAYDNPLLPNNDFALKDAQDICDSTGANCSKLRISEWNNVNDDVKVNKTSDYAIDLYKAYMNSINYDPGYYYQMYQWSEVYKYNNTEAYSQYPQRWSMLSEPLLDNEIYQGFNVTRNMSTAIQANATIKNQSASQTDMQTVLSEKDDNHNMVILNTNVYEMDTIIDFNISTFYNNITRTGSQVYVRNGTLNFSVTGEEFLSLNIHNDTFNLSAPRINFATDATNFTIDYVQLTNNLTIVTSTATSVDLDVTNLDVVKNGSTVYNVYKDSVFVENSTNNTYSLNSTGTYNFAPVSEAVVCADNANCIIDCSTESSIDTAYSNPNYRLHFINTGRVQLNARLEYGDIAIDENCSVGNVQDYLVSS